MAMANGMATPRAQRPATSALRPAKRCRPRTLLPMVMPDRSASSYGGTTVEVIVCAKGFAVGEEAGMAASQQGFHANGLLPKALSGRLGFPGAVPAGRRPMKFEAEQPSRPWSAPGRDSIHGFSSSSWRLRRSARRARSGLVHAEARRTGKLSPGIYDGKLVKRDMTATGPDHVGQACGRRMIGPARDARCAGRLDEFLALMASVWPAHDARPWSAIRVGADGGEDQHDVALETRFSSKDSRRR